MLHTHFLGVFGIRDTEYLQNRVYTAVADEPATVRDISERAGVSDGQTRRAVAKLADNCLAGLIPGSLFDTSRSRRRYLLLTM